MRDDYTSTFNNWEEAPEDDIDSQERPVLDAVLDRIETAKLYESLLRNQLFEDGIARPELVEMVTQEIRQFVLSRLQSLVGIASYPQLQANEVFTEDQIHALRALADKLLSNSTVKVDSAPYTAPNRPPQPKAKNRGRPIIQKASSLQVKNNRNGTPPKRIKGPRPAQRTDNISKFTGQDYSQAVNPNAPPAPPMSVAATVAAMNAMAAEQVSSAAKKAGEGDLLSTMIQLAQSSRAHIKEEE